MHILGTFRLSGALREGREGGEQPQQVFGIDGLGPFFVFTVTAHCRAITTVRLAARRCMAFSKFVSGSRAAEMPANICIQYDRGWKRRPDQATGCRSLSQ